MAPQLRTRGIDARNVYDLRQQGWSDAGLLQSSAADGRVVVTHNIRDFVALHHTYRARLQQVFNEQQIRLTHTPDDEAQVLRVGKLLGAVIFVDTSFQKELRGSYYADASKAEEGTHTEYSASVSIRGVNVETSEVLWSGMARYPNPVGGIEDALAKLTCQALATGWGFRPPGQHEITSQAMYSVGESNSPLQD